MFTVTAAHKTQPGAITKTGKHGYNERIGAPDLVKLLRKIAKAVPENQGQGGYENVKEIIAFIKCYC